MGWSPSISLRDGLEKTYAWIYDEIVARYRRAPEQRFAGRTTMRVVVHDYAGHPFQVELSRALARRGHDVLHLYSASITTPRGTLTKRPEDPESFSVEAITVSEHIPREDLVTRWRLEACTATASSNDSSGSSPTSSSRPIRRSKRRRELPGTARTEDPFVYWVQDLIGEATKRLLPGQVRAIARPVGSYYQYLERRLLWSADYVVVISADFLPFVPADAEVIENWAPIERLPVLPRRTSGRGSTGSNRRRTSCIRARSA